MEKGSLRRAASPAPDVALLGPVGLVVQGDEEGVADEPCEFAEEDGLVEAEGEAFEPCEEVVVGEGAGQEEEGRFGEGLLVGGFGIAEEVEDLESGEVGVDALLFLVLPDGGDELAVLAEGVADDAVAEADLADGLGALKEARRSSRRG